MVNVLSGSEIEKVTVEKLRDVEKLYNLEEEEAEIADKEIRELNDQKEVAEKEDVGGNKFNARGKRKEGFGD